MISRIPAVFIIKMAKNHQTSPFLAAIQRDQPFQKIVQATKIRTVRESPAPKPNKVKISDINN